MVINTGNHRALESFLGDLLLFKSCNLDYILLTFFTIYGKKKQFDSGGIFIQHLEIICISTYLVDLIIAYKIYNLDIRVLHSLFLCKHTRIKSWKINF